MRRLEWDVDASGFGGLFNHKPSRIARTGRAHRTAGGMIRLRGMSSLVRCRATVIAVDTP
jgi:hypothetical protein